ncbi:MAG: hypothetical protein R2748_11515 [Bryobacterales bacterium]
MLTLALALLTYGLAAVLGGNGFLAVYLAGIVLATRTSFTSAASFAFIRRRGLADADLDVPFAGVAGLSFPLGRLGHALLISFFLMCSWRSRSGCSSAWPPPPDAASPVDDFVGGLALRQPIILGTFPLLHGIERAEMIFNIVFFIALTSVLLQGTT